MTSFWSAWVIILTVACIASVTWLLFATRKGEKYNSETDQTTGHEYDGIEELDNPLPRWWFWLFLLSIVYAIGYVIYYPAMGNFKGISGWTSEKQWREELKRDEELYAPIFKQYADQPIMELAENPKALKTGQRIFANNCAVCHGSAGTGSFGFPNLTDSDWLYGGDPEAIKTTILDGRSGVMPAWSALGEEAVTDLTNYVLNISGTPIKSDANSEGLEAASVASGEKLFQTNCVACHGADGKGNKLLGAPNLTDNVWLYGGSPLLIKHTLRNGRNGRMPAHKELLGEDKVHVLSAYVYQLSKQ